MGDNLSSASFNWEGSAEAEAFVEVLEEERSADDGEVESEKDRVTAEGVWLAATQEQEERGTIIGDREEEEGRVKVRAGVGWVSTDNG